MSQGNQEEEEKKDGEGAPMTRPATTEETMQLLTFIAAIRSRATTNRQSRLYYTLKTLEERLRQPEIEISELVKIYEVLLKLLTRSF